MNDSLFCSLNLFFFVVVLSNLTADKINEFKKPDTLALMQHEICKVTRK